MMKSTAVERGINLIISSSDVHKLTFTFIILRTSARKVYRFPNE